LWKASDLADDASLNLTFAQMEPIAHPYVATTAPIPALHPSKEYQNMHRFLLTLTATASVLAASTFVPSGASATTLNGPTGLRPVFDGMNPIQNVAVCFYVDGWNGPGLYNCGYRNRHGQGWHGRRDGNHDQRRTNDRGRRDDHNGRNNSTEGRRY
jgi:hypothetical protein